MPSSTPPPRKGPAARKSTTSSGRPAAGNGTGRPVSRGKGAQSTPRAPSYKKDRATDAGRDNRRAEGNDRFRDAKPGAPRAGGERGRPSRDGETRSPRSDRPYRSAGDSSDRRTGPPRRDRDASEGRARPYRSASGGSERRSGPPRRDSDASERGGRPYRDSDARGPRSPKPYSARGGDSRSRAPRTPPPLSPEELKRKRAGETARDKGWGGVARRGAVNIESTGEELPSGKQSRTPDPLGDWELVEAPVAKAAGTEKAKARAKYTLPGDVASDVRKAFIGTAYMREKMVMTLTRAAEAYDRHRYEEALRLGRIVADATPGVAPVRELTGLAAYRAERWAMAKIHLRSYFTISGDPEHLPLVMDADRANHRYRAVEKTYGEVIESEPTAEVIAESRIVLAATWADQQRYEEAIELLTKAGAAKNLRNPSYRHVRLWYALADVYDRAGDTASARELFARIVLAEPDAYDAKERLAELGMVTPRKNRKRRSTPVSKKKVD